VSRVGHLTRRFFTSLSRRPVEATHVAWVASWLSPDELELWHSMSAADQRHSVDVARRFRDRRSAATPAEMAGALLHDVGKTAAGLGPFRRVVATVVGPRTALFRTYHDHEAIGAAMAAEAGADPVTVALIEGRGSAATDLRAADDSI
jgi:hypothetical protein